jgi:hypothetical protein
METPFPHPSYLIMNIGFVAVFPHAKGLVGLDIARVLIRQWSNSGNGFSTAGQSYGFAIFDRFQNAAGTAT